MIRLKAPAGASSFSHDGHEAPIPADGIVEVPEHVGAVLLSHGFTPHDAKAERLGEGGDALAREAIDNLDGRVRKLEGGLAEFDKEGRLVGGLAEKVDALDRKGLFRALKMMGVAASATLKTEELEATYEAEAKKRDDAAVAAAQPAAEPAAPAAAAEAGQKPAEG
jgi:nucleoid-associated protein YgaU